MTSSYECVYEYVRCATIIMSVFVFNDGIVILTHSIPCVCVCVCVCVGVCVFVCVYVCVFVCVYVCVCVCVCVLCVCVPVIQHLLCSCLSYRNEC